MRRDLRFVVIWTMVLALLMLAACGAQPESPYAAEMLLNTPAQRSGVLCEACDQATLAAALTQDKNNADNQAAATADIMRANAQATLNSANATLNAALTQEQNDANVIAARVAETAAILRANAQATLVAAGSTQSAAMTQDAIRQTQMADLATSEAQLVVNQQINEALAASTQTAVANSIATQTQVAVATSQWYADQERQRAEQRKGPIAFLWMWCLPVFIVLFAGLVLWGFWRWLRIRQSNQRILEDSVEQLQAPKTEVTHHEQNDLLAYLESKKVADNNRYQRSKPDYRVSGWMDEVKRKLQSRNKKDEDDDTDN